MQRAAHSLHPGRAPKLGVERQPCFLTSFLEVTMGSKTHLGPRVHVLGTPRLGLQGGKIQPMQLPRQDHSTLSPLTAVTPDACLKDAPWPGQS